MKTTTRIDIVSFIQKNKKVTVKKLSQKFDLSTQMIHRHIKRLLADKEIIKVGSAPKVWYQPIAQEPQTKQAPTPNKTEDLISIERLKTQKIGMDGIIRV